MATLESTKPPLPSYSDMILGAIEALDDKAGSNKSSISRYIESKYADQLPEAHSTLLAAHLARMKESGDVVMLNSNYLKPGPDTPAKRSRGRPPKVHTPPLPGTETPSPRPWGRPPKQRDPLAAALEKASSGIPKSRGRPPKKARVEGEDDHAPSPASAASTGSVPGAKRCRGRPPKVNPPFADVGFA